MNVITSALLAGLLALGAVPLHGQVSIERESGSRANVDGAVGFERPLDWGQRDVEGRWALIAADRANDPDADRGWTAWLIEQGELQLLEWLVITRATNWASARAALVGANAPTWIRASVLRMNSTDSHARSAARQDLTRAAGRFVAWVDRHQADLDPQTLAFAAELDAQPDDAAAQHDSPPYTDEQLFGLLWRADGAVPFGERLEAQPGVVYVHQVERALDAASARRRHEPALIEAVLGLTGHADRRLAQSAALAFCDFPADEIPVASLTKLAADRSQDPGVREAAFLATTYGEPIAAYVRLHVPALDPDHPHWRPALSRLADLGDDYSLHQLEQLDLERLSSADRDFAQSERERLATRVAWLAQRVQVMLERRAFADLTCDPCEGSLGDWVDRELRAVRDDPEVREVLEQLAESYVPEPGIDETGMFGTMQSRVRRYARGLVE